MSEKEIKKIFAEIFSEPSKGKISRIRIMEVAAIASYHSETGIPIVKVLVSDDAPQFKLITKDNLLTVLNHPEIPLHNNRSENGARVEKCRADVSLQTKTDEGTKAKDTMMSIVETCKKLGVSSYKFIHDRISWTFEHPSLAELIKLKPKKCKLIVTI